MEDYISTNVLTFVDATKVFIKVTHDVSKERLQDDLDKFALFNFGKCKCIGRLNIEKIYKMEDAVVGRTSKEKELGVTFSAMT